MSEQKNGIMGESKITDHIIDCLSFIPLFDGLSTPDLKNIARHMHFVEVDEGELVFEEGESGDYVCFVASGSVDVIKESSAGERATLATLARGRSIGEMALIDEFPRSATVIAKTRATLITLSRKNFNLILAHHPQAGIPVLKGISRLVSMNLRKTSGQLADLMLPLD